MIPALTPVIISDSLFDTVWRDAYEYWRGRGYWEKQHDFKSYLFQGWVRPDHLPAEAHFQFSKEWWEFFRALTAAEKFGLTKSGVRYIAIGTFLSPISALAYNRAKMHS